jgi:hypothetical protein
MDSTSHCVVSSLTPCVFAARYDSILRTDEDVFLTPQLLTWQPPHNTMFGEVRT